MAHGYMKICSMSLTIRKMQIKTTKNKVLGGYGEILTLYATVNNEKWCSPYGKQCDDTLKN